MAMRIELPDLRRNGNEAQPVLRQPFHIARLPRPIRRLPAYQRGLLERWHYVQWSRQRKVQIWQICRADGRLCAGPVGIGPWRLRVASKLQLQ